MADTGLPFLPGTATVSEVLAVLEAGLTEMKFFPAEAAGGAAFLSSVASPVPAARFCPTGGITAATAAGYLALPNVGCVGGSWLTPADLVAARDWEGVSTLAATPRRSGSGSGLPASLLEVGQHAGGDVDQLASRRPGGRAQDLEGLARARCPRPGRARPWPAR